MACIRVWFIIFYPVKVAHEDGPGMVRAVPEGALHMMEARFLHEHSRNTQAVNRGNQIFGARAITVGFAVANQRVYSMTLPQYLEGMFECGRPARIVIRLYAW